MVGGKDYKTQKTHLDMKDVQDAQAERYFGAIQGQYTRILVPRAKDQQATPNGTETKRGCTVSPKSILNNPRPCTKLIRYGDKTNKCITFKSILHYINGVPPTCSGRFITRDILQNLLKQ